MNKTETKTYGTFTRNELIHLIICSLSGLVILFNLTLEKPLPIQITFPIFFLGIFSFIMFWREISNES